MSAMADYEVWLTEQGMTDSEESRAIYVADNTPCQPNDLNFCRYCGRDMEAQS